MFITFQLNIVAVTCAVNGIMCDVPGVSSYFQPVCREAIAATEFSAILIC